MFLIINFILPIDSESIGKRIKADIVFVLAITHHLVLSQNFSISLIFEMLRMYSKKYVVVEFMPLGLWDGTNTFECPAWYNQDWFKINFENYFELLYIELSLLEKGRTLTFV